MVWERQRVRCAICMWLCYVFKGLGAGVQLHVWEAARSSWASCWCLFSSLPVTCWHLAPSGGLPVHASVGWTCC
jgi:hypothetical protein